MKKILTLLFICSFYVGFSQEKTKDSTASKVSYWEKYSKPSLDNIFTNHFKQYLSSDLIDSADLSKRKKTITLHFNLDKKNKIINLRTNTKNKELSNAIINAFLLFEVDKLNLPQKSILNNYGIQLICNVDKKPTLKCSSIIVYTKSPVFQGCIKSQKDYKSLMKCNNSKVQLFFTNNFDNTLAKRSGESGIIEIYALFKVDKDTKKFIDLKVKAPNEALKYETKRTLHSFPEALEPGYLQGKPTNTTFTLPLKIVAK